MSALTAGDTVTSSACSGGPSPKSSKKVNIEIIYIFKRDIDGFEISPGSINVVPAEARLTIDVRSYDDDVVAELVDRVEREVKAACKREDVTYDLEEIWRIPHTEFSPRVSRAVLDAAEAVGADHQAMVSGAGHDATYLNEITDTAMIFVPSVDGKTHNEAEYTEWEDAVAGARTFAEATKRLAARPDDS